MKPGTTAHQAVRSDTMKRLGRFGLAARGSVYLLLGIIALLIALGHHSGEPDQRGALQELATHAYGLVVLWAIFVGLVAYAVWSFSQAAVGVVGEGDKAFPRVKQFISGCAYAALAASAFSIAVIAHQEPGPSATELDREGHEPSRRAVGRRPARAHPHRRGDRDGVRGARPQVRERPRDGADGSIHASHRRRLVGLVGSVARGVVIGDRRLPARRRGVDVRRQEVPRTGRRAAHAAADRVRPVAARAGRVRAHRVRDLRLRRGQVPPDVATLPRRATRSVSRCADQRGKVDLDGGATTTAVRNRNGGPKPERRTRSRPWRSGSGTASMVEVAGIEPASSAVLTGFSGRSALCLYSAPSVMRTSRRDRPSRCLMSRPHPRPTRTVIHLADARTRAGGAPGLTELLGYLGSRANSR